MAIKKADLGKMNELLANGTTIAEIQRKYPKYEYWEIYWMMCGYLISHPASNFSRPDGQPKVRPIGALSSNATARK